jgi:hypothetical protein
MQSVPWPSTLGLKGETVRSLILLAMGALVGMGAEGCMAMDGAVVSHRSSRDGGGNDPGNDSTPDSLDASSPPDGGAPPERDASVPTDGSSGGPNACKDLSLLLRFDGHSMTSAQGQAPTGAQAGNFAGAKFGDGAVIGSSLVDYAATFRGATVVSPQQGTISGWIKSGWLGACPQMVFWGLDSNGVFTYCENDGQPVPNDWWFGFGLETADHKSMVVSATLARSAWDSYGFNHVVATWSASPKPHMLFAINGQMVDVTVPWSPPSATAAVFEFGDTQNATTALVDDVAVWTRELSKAEIDQVHTAGKSIGDVCGLP